MALHHERWCVTDPCTSRFLPDNHRQPAALFVRDTVGSRVAQTGCAVLSNHFIWANSPVWSSQTYTRPIRSSGPCLCINALQTKTATIHRMFTPSINRIHLSEPLINHLAVTVDFSRDLPLQPHVCPVLPGPEPFISEHIPSSRLHSRPSAVKWRCRGASLSPGLLDWSLWSAVGGP